MAGEDEEGTTIAPAQVVTEEVPAFRDDRKIDPWLELTDAGEDEAEPEVIDALWVERSDPPDGPVPAPMDQLPETADLEPSVDTFERAPRDASRASKFEKELRNGPDLAAYVRDGWDEPRAAPRSASQRGPMSPPPRSPSQRGGMNQPVVVQRKIAKPRRESVRPAIERPRAKGPPRKYPMMLALLEDASSVPRSRTVEPPPPPVPGTFFPAPRAPLPRPPPQDLDEMLAMMAEGLLIGESPDGGTEVRVTLKDEFFAGTELRIRVGGGKVTAILVPPDRTIYWQLNANIEELRQRLSSRGLTVEAITVEEPR